MAHVAGPVLADFEPLPDYGPNPASISLLSRSTLRCKLRGAYKMTEKARDGVAILRREVPRTMLLHHAVEQFQQRWRSEFKVDQHRVVVSVGHGRQFR